MKHGAALPMALFALCLIGGLTVGGAYVARRSVSDARIDQKALELGLLGEQAVADLVGSWGSAGPAGIPIGATVAVAASATPEARAQVWVTRIGARLYWLCADVRRTSKPLLYRRMAVLILADSIGVGTAPQAAWFDLP